MDDKLPKPSPRNSKLKNQQSSQELMPDEYGKPIKIYDYANDDLEQENVEVNQDSIPNHDSTKSSLEDFPTMDQVRFESNRSQDNGKSHVEVMKNTRRSNQLSEDQDNNYSFQTNDRVRWPTELETENFPTTDKVTFASNEKIIYGQKVDVKIEKSPYVDVSLSKDNDIFPSVEEIRWADTNVRVHAEDDEKLKENTNEVIKELEASIGVNNIEDDEESHGKIEKDENKKVEENEIQLKKEKEVLEIVIEQWYTVKSEDTKVKSNEEVLNEIVAEAREEDWPSVSKLIAWAKDTNKKRSKTETMKLREKKKVHDWKDFYLNAADNIVIEDKTTIDKKSGAKTIKSEGGIKFQINVPDEPKFQVRKVSVIKPPNETIVTNSWILDAVRHCEGDLDVTLSSSQFRPLGGDGGIYSAKIVAQVGGRAKTYDWVIKPAVKTDTTRDFKDTYMVGDLGAKIVKFVEKTATSRKALKKWIIPFQSVIFTDDQYAIFDDIKDYSSLNDVSGLDLNHAKICLRALARLHAMSYAYFQNPGDTDIKAFSEILKLMIDKPYQSSASVDDRKNATEKIQADFNLVLHCLNEEDPKFSSKIEKKFSKDQLFAIFKGAHSSSSSFSVLCHGFPEISNFHFSYDENNKPNDVKLLDFSNARYGNAVTDLVVLFNTSIIGSKIGNQRDFLMRFVYYETLVGTFKKLGIPIGSIPDYETFQKEFKQLEQYGCLVGAIYLAKKIKSGVNNRNTRSNEPKIFKSKLIGAIIGGDNKELNEQIENSPMNRLKNLFNSL